MEVIKNKGKKASYKKIINDKLHSKEKSLEGIWDDLLKTPESNLLLELMSKDALKEFKEGKTEEGGLGD
jgi:hypothetical protein